MATAPDVHWESWRRLRDPAAFEALVRPELGRALSFARSLGCSDADAEDVLQESLVRLAAERSEGPSRIGVRAWLYRTVRDRAKSRRRSWWRLRHREARAARPEASPPRTGDLEVREQVEQALAALPDAEREAVRLRYLQDLDYRDMAHVLGVSENACRTRVHRALESLKKRFGAGVATMVAALPVPAPAHSDHLLREVLRAAVPVPVAGTVVAAWSILGGGLAAAAALALFLPPWAGAPPLPRTPPAPVPGAPSKSAVASARRESAPPKEETPDSRSADAPNAGAAAAAAAPSSGTKQDRSGGPTVADAVALLAEVADYGWSKGLHESAAVIYGTILRIDPAHKRASERVATDDRDDQDRSALDDRLARASTASAGILSGIGAAMAAAGDEKGARALWAKALLVDGQDPLANERLGNRQVEGRWVSQRAEIHRRFEQKWGEAVDRCRKYDPFIARSARTTGISAAAEVFVVALEGDGLLLETDLSEQEGRTVLADLARVRFLVGEFQGSKGDRVRKGEDGRTRFLLFAAGDPYARIVEAFDRIPPDSKDAAKKAPVWVLPGSPSVVLAPFASEEDARRVLSRAIAEDDVRAVYGALDPWIHEGLVRILSLSTGAGSFEADTIALRSLVARFRDLPLSDLVQKGPETMDEGAKAKAWSVLQFLRETDSVRFRQFLEVAAYVGRQGKEARGGKGAKDDKEEELVRCFKSFRTWKDMDEAWRAWVLDVQGK